MLTFVQFEFPWALGPPEGRYVVRERAEAEPGHFVTFDASERQSRRRWKQWWQAPGPSTPVGLSRVTVVNAGALDEREAAAWLERTSAKEAVAAVQDALRVVNRVLQAQRVAAADPSVVDVRVEQAVRLLAGYGSPDAVAGGEGKATKELPGAGALEGLRPARERRTRGVDTGARFARLLSGADYPLMCEELLLRARTDVEDGRLAAATLMTHLALEAASSELGDDPDVEAADLDRVGLAREVLADAAEGALEDRAPDDAVAILGAALDALEATLRHRLLSRAR